MQHFITSITSSPVLNQISYITISCLLLISVIFLEYRVEKAELFYINFYVLYGSV